MSLAYQKRQNAFLEKKFKSLDKNIFKKRILVVGCGGVGSNLLRSLVQSGFLNLVVCDTDLIDKTNLGRQFFFERQIGKFKVDMVVENLKLINSKVKIKKFKSVLNDKNYKKICLGCDLIIDTTDNILSRFLIEEISYKLKIDWIYSGAIRDQSMICVFYHKDKSKYFNQVFKKKDMNEKCSEVGVLNSTINITCGFIMNCIFRYYFNKKKDREILKFNGLENNFFKIKF